MKVPAVKANIHKLAELMFPRIIPKNIPRKQSTEDTMLYVRACFTDIPARNNTAKSPTIATHIS